MQISGIILLGPAHKPLSPAHLNCFISRPGPSPDWSLALADLYSTGSKVNFLDRQDSSTVSSTIHDHWQL